MVLEGKLGSDTVYRAEAHVSYMVEGKEYAGANVGPSGSVRHLNLLRCWECGVRPHPA
jgi:hypothetical protein